MDTRTILALGLAVAAAPVTAQETYVLDPGHSRPAFEVRHLGYSTHFGWFGTVAGKVTIDRAAKKGSVDITIDAASIKLFDPRLDAPVKGEKFLNVEKYPTITFKSSDLKFNGDQLAAVDGELTMLGMSKPVSLKVVDFKCGDHPFNKKPMCGGDASATIKRSDWGMTQGVQSLTPADEVVLRVPFEAFRE